MSGFHGEMRRSVGAGVESAAFFGSLMSGFLLGLAGDWWLGTRPVFTVIGIVAGSATGFWKMWQWAKGQDDARR